MNIKIEYISCQSTGILTNKKLLEISIFSLNGISMITIVIAIPATITIFLFRVYSDPTT